MKISHVKKEDEPLRMTIGMGQGELDGCKFTILQNASNGDIIVRFDDYVYDVNLQSVVKDVMEYRKAQIAEKKKGMQEKK